MKRALQIIVGCIVAATVAATTTATVVLYTSLASTESGPLGQAFEKKTGSKVEIFRMISEKVVQRAVWSLSTPRRCVAMNYRRTIGVLAELIAWNKLSEGLFIRK